MRKLSFWVVLVFLVNILFAQTASDYDKILRGDVSAFAGYYVNGKKDRICLQADGTTSPSGQEAGGLKKATGDAYEWGVMGENFGSFHVLLIPVGVPFPFYKVETDTTRVRLTAGHEVSNDPNDVYYRETTFPATHSTADNIRLRTAQNLNLSTITVLKKGTQMLIQEWGNVQTIDGNSARWAYVYTSDGFHGWCYSGYLEELKR